MNLITDPSAAQHVRRTIDQAMLDRVLAERDRQDQKFGPQSHLDGTGGELNKMAANRMRSECNKVFAEGLGTWRHILAEEFAEALAETDPVKLQKELIELAAVAVNWAGDLEARQLGLNLGPSPAQREAHQALALAEAQQQQAG